MSPSGGSRKRLRRKRVETLTFVITSLTERIHDSYICVYPDTPVCISIPAEGKRRGSAPRAESLIHARDLNIHTSLLYLSRPGVYLVRIYHSIGHRYYNHAHSYERDKISIADETSPNEFHFVRSDVIVI